MISHPIRLSLLSSIAALAIGTSPAQTPVAPAKLTNQEEFSNLPEENRKEFSQHLLEASKLFSQKRIFESLDELDKAEAIFPDSPEIDNIRGSCYVEFRDFDRARQLFQKALELSPDAPTILFNIAEVDFCARNWARAEKEFTELLPKLKKEQESMKDLVEFKILLCKIKTDQVDEARKLVDKHGFMDDSPYHFFAQAAIAFNDGDKVAAEQWLARALRIFRNPQILAPWQDTLIEFGYIKSFYGGNISDEEE